MSKLKTPMSGTDRAEYGKNKKKKRQKKFEKLGYFDLKAVLKEVGFRVLPKHTNESILVMSRKRAGVRSDAVVIDKDNPRLTLRTISKLKGELIEYLVDAYGKDYADLWKQAEQKLSIQFSTKQGRRLADGERAFVQHKLETSNYSDARLPETAWKGYMKRAQPYEDDVQDDTSRKPPSKNDAYSYLSALVSIGHEEPYDVGEQLLKKLGVKVAKGMSFKPDDAVNYAIKSGLSMKEVTKIARIMWKGNSKCQRTK